jgi:hypothetical protein
MKLQIEKRKWTGSVVYNTDSVIWECSFAGTGAVSTLIAWFILPEVTRRTPGEIDEL